MPTIKNLDARTGADYIGDDTTALLTLINTSTGRALDVVGDDGSTSNPALKVTFSANVAGATVAPLQLVASTASQAFIQFSGVFMSNASYGATNAFVIPVYHESERVWGYINCAAKVTA